MESRTDSASDVVSVVGATESDFSAVFPLDLGMRLPFLRSAAACSGVIVPSDGEICPSALSVVVGCVIAPSALGAATDDAEAGVAFASVWFEMERELI